LKENYENASTLTETPTSSGSLISLKSTSLIKIDSKSFIRKNNAPIDDFYVLENELGAGTYGFVRSALHKPSGFRRAVKTIVKRDSFKSQELQMLCELEMLRRSDHPNILRAYELYEDEASFHLVTELCTGGELFDRIVSWSTPSENLIAKIFFQIMSAVAYCHEKGILHRDIKPENMLFTSVEEDSVIKIIDFGVSCLFREGDKFSSKYGTPFYIAPEVLKQSYNEKCDIWSCGVVLYVMLCGCPPFGGRSNQEIVRNVLRGEVVFYSPDWDNISREVKELVSWMLTYDPMTRPSARDVLEHSWLQSRVFGDKEDNPLAESVLLNLAKFKVSTRQAEQRFQYAVLSFIATQLMSNREIEDLAKIFADCDQNHDGLLSPDEIKNGFVKSKMIADVSLIMSECDADLNGFIDYTEFLTATINWKASISQKRLEAAFVAFDLNRDGKISVDELKAIFADHDELDDEVWQALLDEADYNKDGVIDLEEFKHAMLRHSVKAKPAALRLF